MYFVVHKSSKGVKMLQNKKLSYMDKVTDETLDIWFPTMKDKNKIKKPKNLPLGKSIYDEADFRRVESAEGSELDKVRAVTTTGKAAGVTGSRERKSKTEDDDDNFSIKSTGKIKSELDALTDDKYNKSSSSKKEEHQPERKSRKDRTPEERISAGRKPEEVNARSGGCEVKPRQGREEGNSRRDEEILDLMYPSMRHLGKDKVNQTDDEISISKQNNRSSNDKHSEEFENDKKGTFTGGAAKIPETISNNENKQADKVSNTDNIKNHSSLDKIDNTVFSNNARKKARNFIQGAEDFSENAYQDEKGIWTIGYGHTKGVKPGDKITREEAEKLYAEDFKIHSEPLKHVKVPLNDNEKAALASLVFNIGEPQFKNSTVLRKLNEGDKKAAAEAFKLFCKESKTKMIDGKPVKKLEFSKGLYNRRVKEMELFLTPDDK